MEASKEMLRQKWKWHGGGGGDKEVPRCWA